MAKKVQKRFFLVAAMIVLVGVGCAASWVTLNRYLRTGVIKLEPEAPDDYYVLYFTAEHKVYLRNLQGEVIHQWNLRHALRRRPVRAIRLGEDRSLYVLVPHSKKRNSVPGEIVKIDRHGEPLFRHPLYCHHDFVVNVDKSITILTKQEFQPINSPDFSVDEVRFEGIKTIDQSGKVLWEWSSRDHAATIRKIGNRKGAPIKKYDWLHTNSIYRLPENPIAQHLPSFKAGNLLMSWPRMHLIAILDQETGKILWHHRFEDLKFFHSPVLNFSKSKIVFFDNGGKELVSKIRIFDPIERQTQDIYTTSSDPHFFSPTHGAVWPMGADHFLVLQSTHSRLLIVSTKGNPVWEFVSPHLERLSLSDRLLVKVMREEPKNTVPKWADYIKIQGAMPVHKNDPRL